LDSILVFNKLSKESILEVVSLRLKDITDRLRDRRITLDVDDGAKDWLAMTGYSDVYGARAIARVVRTKVSPTEVTAHCIAFRSDCLQRDAQVLFPLAQKMLSGTIR
jgi:ATP-dependent Clp protease ATP-binding subunit ClpB